MAIANAVAALEAQINAAFPDAQKRTGGAAVAGVAHGYSVYPSGLIAAQRASVYILTLEVAYRVGRSTPYDRYTDLLGPLESFNEWLFDNESNIGGYYIRWGDGQPLWSISELEASQGQQDVVQWVMAACELRLADKSKPGPLP